MFHITPGNSNTYMKDYHRPEKLNSLACFVKFIRSLIRKIIARLLALVELQIDPPQVRNQPLGKSGLLHLC